MTLSQHCWRDVFLSRSLRAANQGCSLQEEGCVSQRSCFRSSSLLESRDLPSRTMVSGSPVEWGSCAVSSSPPAQHWWLPCWFERSQMGSCLSSVGHVAISQQTLTEIVQSGLEVDVTPLIFLPYWHTSPHSHLLSLSYKDGKICYYVCEMAKHIP